VYAYIHIDIYTHPFLLINYSILFSANIINSNNSLPRTTTHFFNVLASLLESTLGVTKTVGGGGKLNSASVCATWTDFTTLIGERLQRKLNRGDPYTTCENGNITECMK
jgi:hypothetical protein